MLHKKRADVTDIPIEIGARFVRYIFDGRYDKGEIIEITQHDLIVDFLDTVRSFPKALVTLVYGQSGEEHLMFYGDGTMIKDYRGNHANDTEVTALQDLLDFEKWMV